MQIPENPDNNDICEALLQLRETIIATASVVVLSSLSPAVTAIVTALSAANAE